MPCLFFPIHTLIVITAPVVILTPAGPPITINQMVEYHTGSLDQVFGALADPTRRAILAALREKPRVVTELAGPFPVSLNAISKHIHVLERAGLVSREVRGREHYIALTAGPLREAGDWIDHYRQFWTLRLDALERHIMKKRGGRKK